VWCAASGPVLCLGCFGLVSVCGLGTGVDVGAVALELYALSVVSSSLGGRVVGSCGVRPRGRSVVLGSSVFASFPYKLAGWVLDMSLNIHLYRFSASFPYKLVILSS
jgi:hypothetical protein